MGEMRWPLLMREATAAAYSDCTRVQFRAYVAAGILPPGRVLEGEERWSRRELDRAADRLFQLEEKGAQEAGRKAAQEALDRRRARVSGPQTPTQR